MFDLNRRRFITTSATAVAASGMAPLVAAEEDLEHIELIVLTHRE